MRKKTDGKEKEVVSTLWGKEYLGKKKNDEKDRENGEYTLRKKKD